MGCELRRFAQKVFGISMQQSEEMLQQLPLQHHMLRQPHQLFRKQHRMLRHRQHVCECRLPSPLLKELFVKFGVQVTLLKHHLLVL